MNNITSLKLVKDGPYLADAKELLIEASEKDFESVLIIGLKDGNLQLKNSAHISTVEILGLLRIMEDHLLENISNG